MKRYDKVVFVYIQSDHPQYNVTLFEAVLFFAENHRCDFGNHYVCWAKEYGATLKIGFDWHASYSLGYNASPPEFNEAIRIYYNSIIKHILPDFNENTDYFEQARLWHEAKQIDNELQQSQQWFMYIFYPLLEQFSMNKYETPLKTPSCF